MGKQCCLSIQTDALTTNAKNPLCSLGSDSFSKGNGNTNWKALNYYKVPLIGWSIHGLALYQLDIYLIPLLRAGLHPYMDTWQNTINKIARVLKIIFNVINFFPILDAESE